MRDKIFLLWSGDNTVAQKIKFILESKHNYVCYIGGNHTNDSQMLSIGDTVIRQMKMCNQAIVIFQNKNDSGVSNNLFFELGYVSASYGMKKVHCVKRSSEIISLPSDFDNAFIENIDGQDIDEYVENVVKYFLSRQKLTVDTNKIQLINNRYIMHEMIQSHYSDIGSKCADYELAQYILFYQEAAIMYKDEGKVLDELREFKKLHNAEFSIEVSQAVNLSIAILEVLVGLITVNEITYISDEVFRKYYNSCKDMIEDIKDDDVGIFDEWAKVFVSENLAYVCSLYALNPNIKTETAENLFKKVIDYGQLCLGFIKKLESYASSIENNDCVGLIVVFKAYIDRHLFTACSHIKKSNAEKWLALSLKERKSLLRSFDNNSVDSKIYTSLEIEYYLCLVEYLQYMGKSKIDEFDYIMYINELDAFISQFSNKNNIHAYVYKIINQHKLLT